MMKQRFLLLLLWAGLMSMTVWAVDPIGGNCGASGHESDVTWTFSDEDGDDARETLTISGTGAMADYSASPAPWRENAEAIKSIVIHKGVTHIGSGAFSWCESLASVDIPSGVTSIGSDAFLSCTSLTSVALPSSVTSIGNRAFLWCSNLRSVTLYSPSCALGGVEDEESGKTTEAFYGTYVSLQIYVFNEYVDTYKSADYWSDYASKIKAITIPARQANAGEYWTTYYNNLSDVEMPDGTQVFKVALSGSSLTLTEIDDRIVTRGEGVVLKTTSSSILPKYAASGSATSYSDNDLQGTMSALTNPGNAYVLNYKAAIGVGFYKLSESGTIGAGKAYLTYSGAGGAPDFLRFDEDETGLEEVQGSGLMVHDEEGKKVFRDGKLYILRDGITYDALGRKVK